MNILDLDELATLDFNLSSEERAAIEVVKRFAQKDVAAVAQRYEHDNVYPTDLVQKARELGLFGLLVPHAYGGAGVSYKALAIVFEELSRVWMGFAGILGTHTMMSGVIAAFGTDEQQRDYLPALASGATIGGTAITEPHAGSDVQAIRTTAMAVEGGYRLNGTKTFLTNGVNGSLFLIVAKTDPDADPPYHGISLFLAQKGDTFYMSRAVDKLGYKSVDTADAVLEDHVVPRTALLGDAPGRGFHQMMAGLESGRINVAARAVGVARAALEQALIYSQQRHTFGKPIADHQAIQLMLADMATKIEAARLLTLRAAAAKDRGRRVDLEVGMAKLFASEICVQVCLDAMRIHGGYGYTKDFVVERFYRDAPLMIIGEGTNEIQRLVIARSLLKRHRLE